MKEMTILDLVSLIVGGSWTAASESTASLNPIDSVELVSITLGMLIFLYFAVTISYSSYKRKKEMDAHIAEWKKAEEERGRRFREELSKLG